MLTTLLILLGTLVLTACDGRDAIPPEANHVLLWWVGLTAGLALLAAAVWMCDGVLRRHSRRADRRDDRDDRSA